MFRRRVRIFGAPSSSPQSNGAGFLVSVTVGIEPSKEELLTVEYGFHEFCPLQLLGRRFLLASRLGFVTE